MLAKSYDIYPKLHDMPVGSVGGSLKVIAWRLYEFPNPGEWSVLRHENDSLYLAEFSDLADILAKTTQ
jgi:hypothetical protein